VCACVIVCVRERVSDSRRLSRQEWEECIGILNQGFISRLGLFRIVWLPFFIFLLIGMLLEAAGESYCLCKTEEHASAVCPMS